MTLHSRFNTWNNEERMFCFTMVYSPLLMLAPCPLTTLYPSLLPPCLVCGRFHSAWRTPIHLFLLHAWLKNRRKKKTEKKRHPQGSLFLILELRHLPYALPAVPSSLSILFSERRDHTAITEDARQALSCLRMMRVRERVSVFFFSAH